jgi:DNA-binding HxlR family transcriptional regulator
VNEEKCLQAREVMKQRFRDVLVTLTRKWNGEILLAGNEGARRFSEYRRAIVGVSDRMLTLRLRELEALGLLSRTVVPNSRVRVLYTPTRRGVELLNAVRPLFRWSEQDMAEAEAPSASAS